jgi:hypothetical protein
MMNLARVEGWSTARPFVDLANLVRPYGSTAAPWDESVPPASYVNGYPVGDFGGYLDLTGQTGTYAVTWKGAGTVTWFWAGRRRRQRRPRSGASPAWFSVTGTNRADPFRDLHVYTPGYDQTGEVVFTPEFVADCAGCRRFA